jgi:hypothetical protein
MPNPSPTVKTKNSSAENRPSVNPRPRSRTNMERDEPDIFVRDHDPHHHVYHNPTS